MPHVILSRRSAPQDDVGDRRRDRILVIRYSLLPQRFRGARESPCFPALTAKCVRPTLRIAAVSFTDATLTPMTTVIRAVHVNWWAGISVETPSRRSSGHRTPRMQDSAGWATARFSPQPSVMCFIWVPLAPHYVATECRRRAWCSSCRRRSATAPPPSRKTPSGLPHSPPGPQKTRRT